MKRNFKFLIFIVTLLIIGVIIIAAFINIINKNKKIIICLDARARWL